MATDATGAPTSLGIPKFNTAADAPSGLGGNAQMDAIDALIAARVVKPAGIVSGEAAVWNGASFDRSTVTRVGPTSLGSGTPDATKVLAGDGTWQPGVVRLFDSILAVDTANFDITSISGSFAQLKLTVYARGDTAAAAAGVQLRFNNDSAANYDHQVVFGVGATAGGTESFAQTSAQIGTMPANTAGANLFGDTEAWIANYANTTNNKTLVSSYGYKTGTVTGSLTSAQFAAFWRSNSAINRITVLPSAGNFKAGSRVTLYGLA